MFLKASHTGTSHAAYSGKISYGILYSTGDVCCYRSGMSWGPGKSLFAGPRRLAETAAKYMSIYKETAPKKRPRGESPAAGEEPRPPRPSAPKVNLPPFWGHVLLLKREEEPCLYERRERRK